VSSKKLLLNFIGVFIVVIICLLLIQKNVQDRQPQTKDQIDKLKHNEARQESGGMADSEQYENKLLPNSESERKILSVIEEIEKDTRPGFENFDVSDGRFLRLLTEAVDAKRVVEIGASTGTPGLWFTMALKSTDGKLITYESDDNKIKTARENFRKAGVDSLVTIIEGDPNETIKKHKEFIDILFICAEKESYIDYLNKLLPFVRTGGLILARNIDLRGGKIGDYINTVATNPELDTVFYQNGPGFSITIKKRPPAPEYLYQVFEDTDSNTGESSIQVKLMRISESEEPVEVDVPFVTTPYDIVDKMLELADVKKDDLLYDLGCGDGRIVVTAAKRYGCRAIGFDIDPLCVKKSIENVQSNNVENLVEIEKKDIFTLDLSRADVITLFLLPELNVRLIPQLEKLRPGTRIVSHNWDMKGIKPDKVIEQISEEDKIPHKIYLWTAPIQKED